MRSTNKFKVQLGLRKCLTAWNSIKCMISMWQVFTIADPAVDGSSKRCFNKTVLRFESSFNYCILGAQFLISYIMNFA